jgi:hypothetical protein
MPGSAQPPPDNSMPPVIRKPDRGASARHGSGDRDHTSASALGLKCSLAFRTSPSRAMSSAAAASAAAARMSEAGLAALAGFLEIQSLLLLPSSLQHLPAAVSQTGWSPGHCGLGGGGKERRRRGVAGRYSRWDDERGKTGSSRQEEGVGGGASRAKGACRRTGAGVHCCRRHRRRRRHRRSRLQQPRMRRLTRASGASQAPLTQCSLSGQPTPLATGQQSWRRQKRLKKKGRLQAQLAPEGHSCQPKGSHMVGTFGLSWVLVCGGEKGG